MHVKCPHCGALFELESEVVEDSSGWARCGACTQPFNADLARFDESSAGDSGDVLVRKFDCADDAAHFEAQSQRETDRSSFIIEASNQPEIPAYLRVEEEVPGSTPEPDERPQIPLPLEDVPVFSQAEPEPTRSSVGPIDDSNDMPAVDAVLPRRSDIEPAIAVPPQMVMPRGSEENRCSPDTDTDAGSEIVHERRRTIGGFGAINGGSDAYDEEMFDEQELAIPKFGLAVTIVLAVLAVAQIVDMNKRELSQTVFGRPLVYLWCDISRCSSGSLVQVGKIDLAHTSVSAHETEAGVLVVDVHLISRTSLSQPHPLIQITLTDRESIPVVRRVFAAEEYLVGVTPSELSPNVVTEIKLEIANPPDDAVGFEVALVDGK